MSVNNNIKRIAYGLNDPYFNTPPFPIVSQRNPSANDKAPIGQIWINESTNTPYILTSIVANSATWTSTTAGSINTLTADIGGAVGPTAGNISILGGGGIDTTGNPGASTITISTNGDVAVSFLTDAGTAVPLVGVIDIAGGTNMNTSALGNVVSIHLDNSINLPNTTADETSGMYSLNGTRFMHNLGSFNTFLGSASGNLALAGAQENVGIGTATLNVITSGDNNVAVGSGSLSALTTGSNNAALGQNSLIDNIVGNDNTALGFEALDNCNASNNTAVGSNAGGALTSATGVCFFGVNAGLVSNGNNNVAIGVNSLNQITTGANNIGLGTNAGAALTTTDNSNIMIGNLGVAADVNTIRIGTQGVGAGQQDSCFIAGIAGVTVANSAAVLIDTTTGELGTIASSIRFKENVTDMAEKSSAVLDLRPVNFNFIKDETKANQWGLIAEEVLEVFPELVVFDTEGIPSSVRYHDLPVILLNEIKKLQKRIEYLENK